MEDTTNNINSLLDGSKSSLNANGHATDSNYHISSPLEPIAEAPYGTRINNNRTH